MVENGVQDHILCAIFEPEPTEYTRLIREAFPAIKFTYIRVSRSWDFEKIRTEIPDDVFQSTTILCTFNALPRSREEAPKLRWLQLLSAGSNHIQNFWFYKDSGQNSITITTASGIHAPQIAEWAIMTALVHSRRYNFLHDLQKSKQWKSPEEDWNRIPSQVGHRLGVIGYGSIGRQIAKVAKAMGMDVLAYTATPKDTLEKRKDREFVIPGTGDLEGSIPSEWYSGLDKTSLHHFLEQDLDWVVIAVPLTPTTRHFISTEEFAKLRKTGRKPFITNIARGAIIDQEALISALEDGTLGGAALDVTDPEPLPKDNKLWDMNNVIITPHMSSNGTYYYQRAFEVFRTNLKLSAEGRPLINVVNRERGY